MPDYNFLNLSAAEFEMLSRDLLQKRLGVFLESFTTGRDQGIDFRCSTDKAGQIIIQCKRYSDFKSLLTSLKSEVAKVANHKPARYIVTTSVGLTPAQKNTIKALFKPFIKRQSDIFGKDDLNNLLGLYPDIEKRNFKLWLSSTAILDKIINSKIHNQTNFEEEKIKDTIRVYVENDSYYKALDIIKNRRYVIISGIPGIGKTTLARILVYHYLANGFDEFIFLSDSIDDAFHKYEESARQIFLFDDFLGRNFLDKNLTNNEEQKIVRFIEKVNKSKNKIIIFTTREYILTQAKLKYDIFDTPNLEFAKCVIDLSQYTKIVRAKILYNHLFFSGIPVEYIQDILDKKTYHHIIQHPNYNPRIIETITQPDIWRSIEATSFSKKIQEFLNYPESIWKHVYENQISRLSQCLLANLMTAGVPILLEDMKLLIQNFAKEHSSKYGITYSDLEFKKSIRELENTFITVKKDLKNEFAIDYQNPSVQDFLVIYLHNDTNFLKDILQSAIYFNQLFTIFTAHEYTTQGSSLLKKEARIQINPAIQTLIKTKAIKDFDYLNSSLLPLHFWGRWQKSSFSDFKKLKKLVTVFPIESHSDIKEFALERFEKLNEVENDDYSTYVDLLEILGTSYNADGQEVIKTVASNIKNLQHTVTFHKLSAIYPAEYSRYVEYDTGFRQMINDLMLDTANTIPVYLFDDSLSNLTFIKDNLNFDITKYEQIIEKRLSELSHDDDNIPDDDEPYEPDHGVSDDNHTIDAMFESLMGDLSDGQDKN